MIEKGMVESTARIISAIGSPNFGREMDLLLGRAAQFDMSCIFAFSSEDKPIAVYDGYSETVDRGALRSYLKGAYLLDPFYSASIGEGNEGLWRMKDLAPDEFYVSEFASSREVHPCISDQAGTLVEEIGYIISLNCGYTATFSLMRNRGGSTFDKVEFDNLRAITPIVSASLRKHWEIIYQPEGKIIAGRTDTEEVFQRAFGDRLTPAQFNIAKLVLRGHSSISIAKTLSIAEGTVKLHRSNIYKRMNISSQSELFQIFIGHLDEIP